MMATVDSRTAPTNHPKAPDLDVSATARVGRHGNKDSLGHAETAGLGRRPLLLLDDLALGADRVVGGPVEFDRTVRLSGVLVCDPLAAWST